MIHVSWNEALAWAQTLTEKVLSHDKDWKDTRAQLPTEAQWEYACRGPEGDSLVETEYWSGDGEAALEQVGWYAGNSAKRLQPVGQRPANAWGLCDMHGLVWEWCHDEYDENAYTDRGCVDAATGVVSASDDPNTVRVQRGGSFIQPAANCRSAIRSWDVADDESGDYGFRLVVVPGPSRAQSKRTEKKESAGRTQTR